MRCEVCGREIRGPPLHRVIEGARMTVCSRCARFGTADWTPSTPRPIVTRRPRSEIETVERLELVEDYGLKIKRARQRMKMTVEELGKKIGEKASVIKKLEKEELTPDERLVRKLRNALKIELLVAGESPSVPRTIAPAGVRTLGDIIKLEKESASEDEE